MVMRPPSPDYSAEMYTGATRSLNSYPDTQYPMVKAEIASRLRTEPEQPSNDAYLTGLLEQLCQDPEAVVAMLMMLDEMDNEADRHMQELSSQRPAEYDTPSDASGYSMLNAPSSNSVPPSVQYQQLS